MQLENPGWGEVDWPTRFVRMIGRPWESLKAGRKPGGSQKNPDTAKI